MLLLSFLLGFVALALFAWGFVAVAWRVAAQYGRRSLWLVWLIGAAAFWLLNLLRLRLQGMPVHLPPTTDLERVTIYGMLGYGALGCALAALSVRRRQRRSVDGRLTRGAVAAGIGAFFAGMFIVLVFVALGDTGLFSRVKR
jgi:hypothetical protein